MGTVEYQEDSYTEEEIRNTFNPVMREWWDNSFPGFTPPQRYSIVNIHSRINTLVSSPTGSGKTLSAFTAILNELVGHSIADRLENKTYAIYISPLKALGNDIEKNLNQPLKEIEDIYKEKHDGELGIRVGVRTGDTTSYEKQKMLEEPPHILITTPESLAIVLNSPKFKKNLHETEWVIIDEIHSLAENKRGVHLSLSLERLQDKTYFTRIGLSATVSPLEEVGKFLVGYEDPDRDELRNCKIVDVSQEKPLDLKVLTPVENIIKTPYKAQQEHTYRLMDDLIQDHKTTIIFTNTRSATERVVHHLKQRFPKNYTRVLEDDEEEGYMKENFIGAHHGSLSYQHRLTIEDMLKEGELKAVVSSTSLELGIDIGSVDLVILLGSPKSVARGLQRVGRAGHHISKESTGRIIVRDRDDLVECCVLMKSAVENKIDRIDIPRNAYDVLSQQIYGIAIESRTTVEAVWNLIRKSYCYSDITRKKFEKTLKYLKGEYGSLEERHVYAKIWVDEETGELGKRGKLARMIYMTNIGTIPDQTNIRVKLNGEVIGSISEPFLEQLKKGDIFVLGGETYEFRYSQGITAFVNSTSSKSPTVPSWFSEMLPLSYDLAMDIQKFRRLLSEYFATDMEKEEIKKFIRDYLYVDENSTNSIYEFFKEQHLFSHIPHDKRVVVEHYDDEKKKYVIFHMLYGRRTIDVISRAVAYYVSKEVGRDVEFNISDNGFYVVIPRTKRLNAERILKKLKAETLRDLMEDVLEKTEVLKRRFRHCAGRSLMILRNYKGNSKSVSRQQLNSRLLISAVRKLDDDFIILQEARREVLEDLMDIHHAEDVIKSIQTGDVKVKETHTTLPSPFAFNLVTMGYGDIMKMEDKQQFLRRMHEYVLAKIGMDNEDVDPAKA